MSIWINRIQQIWINNTDSWWNPSVCHELPELEEVTRLRFAIGIIDIDFEDMTITEEFSSVSINNCCTQAVSRSNSDRSSVWTSALPPLFSPFPKGMTYWKGTKRFSTTTSCNDKLEPFKTWRLHRQLRICTIWRWKVSSYHRQLWYLCPLIGRWCGRGRRRRRSWGAVLKFGREFCSREGRRSTLFCST